MLTDAKLRQSLFLKYAAPEQRICRPVCIRYRQNRDDLIQDIVDYFAKPVAGLRYPAKAYAVAIIYAHLLEVYFGHNFWQSLSDPDLFCGSAPFYFPTSQSSEVSQIYELSLGELTKRQLFPRLNCQLDQVLATVEAFESEFSVHLKSLPEVVFKFSKLS